MPYVQPFCPNGNINFVQFGSKVEFTKMRTKTCYVRFFKDSLNKRAGTPTLELNEGNVSTFAKFEYVRSSSKTERVCEKTNMISCFFLKKPNIPKYAKDLVVMWAKHISHHGVRDASLYRVCHTKKPTPANSGQQPHCYKSVPSLGLADKLSTRQSGG